MDWSKIGDLVGAAAPIIGSALGGPVGGAAGALVASVLGVSAEPEAVKRAIEADPEAMVKLRAAEMDHARELRRMVIEAETSRLAEINATYRQELSSQDAYVRRARPTFMYIVAGSVLVEALLAGLIILVAPERLADLAVLYGALATPQSIAAGMCGVYLKKRSDDKAVAAGAPVGPPLLETIVGRLAGKGA